MSSSRRKSIFSPSNVLRKIREKGLLRTLRVGFSTVLDTLYDRKSGVSTAELVSATEIPTESANKKHGNCYQPTRARPLKRMLEILNLPKDRIFVDFGCGKGRVLLITAEAGFRRIVGVEYSSVFCGEARANAKKFLEQHQMPPETIQVIEADATTFPILPEHSIFFMYNPFNAVIMEKVIQNIKASLDSHPREAWLIYNCPLQRHVIEKSGAFTDQHKYDLWGDEYIVYHNVPTIATAI